MDADALRAYCEYPIGRYDEGLIIKELWTGEAVYLSESNKLQDFLGLYLESDS